MENNVINTIFDHERVTSTYADIYFHDDYCTDKLHKKEKHVELDEHEQSEDVNIEWVSPSDLLIGKVELNPPFTSKITRGKTHEGILAIGNEILEKEYKQFLGSLNRLILENNESWNHILLNERKLIKKKVEHIFEEIFNHKSKIMNEEIIAFYESSLQDLETHLQSEVSSLLSTVHAGVINTLNIVIPTKLRKEKTILENQLRKKFKLEIGKVDTYYKLLFNNEVFKNNQLINNALTDRNDALQTFCRQYDAERLTATMYIMSLERKKCRVKKMILEQFQSSELAEKLTSLKQRQQVLDANKEKEQKITHINKHWGDKMKKILELFLKFISFSLKMLPEQSTFLLDFQKMVLLQFNEMQKQPTLQQTVLIDEGNLTNIFDFKSTNKEEISCDLKPFTLIGDLSDPVPPRYGSTETLPSDVELPFIRVNRHHVYAKCHGYEDIKKILESQKCQCHNPKHTPINSETLPSPSVHIENVNILTESTSSNESFLIDDMHRLEKCPTRKCWIKRDLFPFLPSYLDFSESNYQRVKAILGTTISKKKLPELIAVENIARSELPFEATKEKYRHAETQCTAQELETVNVKCTCVDGHDKLYKNESIEKISSTLVTDVLTKRKISLNRLLDQNPNLLKIFTDESFDFQL